MNYKDYNIILGSASFSRKEILEQAGFTFTVMTADIDERQYHHTDLAQLVIMIAEAKAKALLNPIIDPSLLITVDQVVACAKEIHHKPATPEAARVYLQRYTKDPATIYTGVVVTNTLTNKQLRAVDIAKVYLKPLSENIIQYIINDPATYHCAGAFQIEDENLQPYIERVEGTIDAIRGLPLNLLKGMLIQARLN